MQTKRLQYIDCIRGAAMLMVVYSHVLTFMMGRIQPSPLGLYMQNIMLPLFFFISGFCAYKADKKWTPKDVMEQVKKKVLAILIPTITMFLLFMLYSGQNVGEIIFHYDKSGYWFTWVLFQIFMVYLIFDVLASKVKFIWAKVLIMVSPLVLLHIVFRFVGYDRTSAHLFEWVKVVGYYYFFIEGALLRCFLPQVERFITNKYVSSLLLVFSVTLFFVNGGVKQNF